jgi:type VI secretion system (T6SS) effector TldE1-like protein
MGFHNAVGDRLVSRRVRWFDTVAVAFVAIAASLYAAAWITNPDQAALASAVLPGDSDFVSFEDRFFQASMPSALRDGVSDLQALDRSVLAAAEMKVRAARELLAQRMMSRDLRSALVEDARVGEPKVEEAKVEQGKVEEAKPAPTSIPLPRARPVTADLAGGPVLGQDSAARQDDRTLMQKLSDLLPGRVTLASLVTGGGLLRSGPDLAALGYDNLTAVYDISAHAVYLPNGLSLEAHSGMGNLRDDPEHVSVPMAGATPPAVYDLKPREKLFHGVQALRMIPTEGSDTNGRTGLLTHSFMLGPKGDSNGCVSIRDYDRFLKAYTDGEINRIVVVPSLSNATPAAQRST